MAIDTLGLNRQMLRITGLSSGLDTDSIVNSLLEIDQYKVDKQFKAKEKIEWKLDAYRDINLLIRNFREDNMSVLNPDTNMFSAKAYNNFDVTLLDETSAVKVSANHTANTGTLTINNITQLATAAKAESQNIFNTDTISTDTALMDLDLVVPLSFVDNEISFSINGEVFTFAETDTLNDVMLAVNANSTANVTMTYSSLKKGFKFVSDSTGSESAVDIVNIKGNAFDATTPAFGISEGTNAGQDAMLEIENISVTKSTNSFTIDGITYTLRDTSASEISFSVERDTEATVDKIVAFIDAYNELLDTLQSKIDETLYSSYEPLTDEERDMLTESQIEKWEEMAKSGLLRNDSNISGLIGRLRESFYTQIESVGKSAADIGLRTGSYDNKGKIFIDEEVLREAIASSPEEVEKIFLNSSDSEDSSTKFSESGLINRMSDMFINYISNATYNTIANTEAELSRAETRMESLIDSMERNEERYWAKYTAMETALSEMNNQASNLLSQLGYSSE